MADQYSLDLEELKHLQSIAKRPRVLDLINSAIGDITKLNESASAAASFPQIPAPISAPAKPSNPTLIYSTLSSFSWDQDNEKVKVYIPLEGVDKEKVETEFKAVSFDVKIHDVEGKNYRCAVPKLNKDIEPEKCKLLVKPNRIIITLFKASKGNWLDLHHKEDKLKPNLEKKQDPMAGIMDLMKNMYQDGDEEMKKTIAKAWTDARSGKTADSMKGFP